MSPSRRVTFATAVLVAAVMALSVGALAQEAGQNLGTVRLTRDVMANGERLPAGTYTVRQVDLPVQPVVGQTPGQSRWVEFVQDGAVKGRELSTVLTGAQIRPVLNPRTPMPAAGRARVDLLKGGEFLRVWINRGGAHYLVHLMIAGAGR